MTRPPGWRRLFRVGGGAERAKREVDDELAFHLEMRVRKLMADGLDEAEARTEAERQFGDVGAVRETLIGIDEAGARRRRWWEAVRDIRSDVRYAVRGLFTRPGFAAVVLLSLGLGIGANTAIFTLVDALLLRTLPVMQPEQLVTVGDPTRVSSLSLDSSPRVDLFSYPEYRELRGAVETVTGLAATGRTGRLEVGAEVTAGGEGVPESPPARLVSGNYFSVLGVRARLGRTFGPEEDRAGTGTAVVVISDGYWRRRLGSDPSVVGRSLRVNGVAYTIVGVMPPEFHGAIVGQMTDLWFPLAMQPSIDANQDRTEDWEAYWLLLIGRQAPGATIERMRAEFNALTDRLLDEHFPDDPDAASGRRGPVRVEPGATGLSRVRATYGPALETLMVAVALVLLVVCANVANLLFARAAARAHEIGLRVALGAGRARLMRQLLTESLVLAGLGGAVGVGLAWVGSSLLLSLASSGPERLPLDAGLDLRVLGFACALTLVTALLFGLAPALAMTGRRVAATARTARPSGLVPRAGRRVGPGRLLVVCQVALSLPLLVATGLQVRSARRLETQDVGLARDRLLMLGLDASPLGLEPASRRQLWHTLLERLRALPAVTQATYSENGIFSGTESGTTFGVPGFVAHSYDDTTASYDVVGPDYFRAIGARLVAGRDLTEADGEGAEPVVVVNETMAGFLFPGASALGHRVVFNDRSYRIAGVVADTKDHTLRGEPVRRLYFPAAQVEEGDLVFPNFEIRTADPAALIRLVRGAVGELDGAVRVRYVRPLSEMMRGSILQDRLVARVASFFGLLALGLAALGLYGVLTYATARRSGEFGVRMALGAEPGAVRRMVLGEAAVLIVAGTAIGLPLALAAARLLRARLFQVSALDPLSIGIALVVLSLTAALAAAIPAARAARVGPLAALKTD